MAKTPDLIILNEVISGQYSELTTPLSESEFFELFSISQVLKDIDLTWEQIELGNVGYGGDGGIDGFYCIINGELLCEDTDLSKFKGEVTFEINIVQSKKESGFTETTINKLISVTEDLLDISKDVSSLKSVYNNELLKSAELFQNALKQFLRRNPEIKFNYYYVTLGNDVHPNVERKSKKLKAKVLELFSGGVFNFSFVGSKRLLELSRQKPKTIYQLILSDSPISTISNAYVCLVKLSSYYQFITDSGSNYIKSMFEPNVRDYQGNVQVNQGIRDTLINPMGEDFWWLNNGITILSTKATLTGKTLTLESPMVVNGLQTSIEIFENFNQLSHDDDRSLLVRVIVPANIDSNERIIRATNSQTSIPIASLRATDNVHRDIEDFFKARGLFYDRRKNQYKNEGKPLDRIVSISFVAQAVMSVLLGRPDDARARPSTLLKNDEDYNLVFNPKYNPNTYLVSTKLLMRIEEYLRSSQLKLSRKDINNLKFYMTMFISWKLINKHNPEEKDLQQINLDEVTDDLLTTTFAEIQTIFLELGGDDTVAKGTDFVEAIKNKLRLETDKE